MKKLIEMSVGELGAEIGRLEAEIGRAIIRFEKEFMGRGPLQARTYLLDDMVLVRLKGVLTQAEVKLVETPDRQRGRYLLKQVRQELLDSGRPMLDAIIRDILGVAVRSVHTDVSTKTGERVIIFILEEAALEREGDVGRTYDNGFSARRPRNGQ